GFGTSSAFEGSGAASAPTGNAGSLFRKAGGCYDTNDNAADLDPGNALPRNSATAANNCASVQQDLGGGTMDLAAGGGGDMAGVVHDLASGPRDLAAGPIDLATPTIELDGSAIDHGVGTTPVDNSGCSCQLGGASPPPTGPLALLALFTIS